MQRLDHERKLAALKQSHAWQEKSLKAFFLRQHRMKMRRGQEYLPAMNLLFGPPGRPAMPFEAKNRYISPLAVEFQKDKAHENGRQGEKKRPSSPRCGLAAETKRLRDTFRAAARETGNGKGAGSEGATLTKAETRNSKDGRGKHKR